MSEQEILKGLRSGELVVVRREEVKKLEKLASAMDKVLDFHFEPDGKPKRQKTGA